MLTQEMHIEQIQRFHKKMNDLDEKIDKEQDEAVIGELLLQYNKLSHLRIKIDEFIEFTLKHELDRMSHSNA